MNSIAMPSVSTPSLSQSNFCSQEDVVTDQATNLLQNASGQQFILNQSIEVSVEGDDIYHREESVPEDSCQLLEETEIRQLTSTENDDPGVYRSISCVCRPCDVLSRGPELTFFGLRLHLTVWIVILIVCVALVILVALIAWHFRIQHTHVHVFHNNNGK